MKQRLVFFGQIGLFWLGWFILSRFLFLAFHAGQTSSLTVTEIATVVFLGGRMDLAMTGYWMLITGILLSLPAIHPRIVFYGNNFFVTLLLTVSTAIVIVDLELYSHWGFRMNTTPLFYMSMEAAGSVNSFRLIILILLFVVTLSAGLYVYFKVLSGKILQLAPLPLKWTLVMLMVTGFLFIPIRSSFSVAPLNTGVVYFHKTKAFPNHAGINVVWNFFYSLSARDNLKYPSAFFSGNTVATLSELEKTDSSPGHFLTTQRPNIILIILESFTANIIAPLGGLKDITPNINELVHEGILFDHFYASGDRTDKGLIAVLSAYPAQPRTSIIRFPQKTQHLPFVSRSLQSIGYHTSFLYGGDAGFSNIASYLTSAGFDRITDVGDFDSELDNSKWGVADQYVFDRLLHDCDNAKNPFFNVMLSLSSHEPFEVPMKPIFTGSDERSLFLNACAYTDKSLGDFVRAARQKSWWKNTLVIITADHGHRFPNPTELKEKERFKIPMLWLGGAVAVKDTVVHTISGQTDIAKTLLSQVAAPAGNFSFSKNILAEKVHPFAVYVFQNGFGYLDPGIEYVYDFDFGKFSNEKGDDKRKVYGQAYMQALFDDYNSR